MKEFICKLIGCLIIVVIGNVFEHLYDENAGNRFFIFVIIALVLDIHLKLTKMEDKQ